MASGFGPEGTGLFSDANEDLPSACSVRARKIRGSESPVVDNQQYTMVIVSEGNFLFCQRHIKIVEVEIDSTVMYHQEPEIGLLPL